MCEFLRALTGRCAFSAEGSNNGSYQFVHIDIGDIGICVGKSLLFLSSGVRLAMHGYCHIVPVVKGEVSCSCRSGVRLAMHGYVHIVFLFLSSRVRLAMHGYCHIVFKGEVGLVPVVQG